MVGDLFGMLSGPCPNSRMMGTHYEIGESLMEKGERRTGKGFIACAWIPLISIGFILVSALIY